MASRVLRAVDDITKCPICLKVMCHPTMLPCFHAFCSECLQIYLKDETKVVSGKRCPLCRSAFNLESGNCSHLPGKFFLEKLINSRKSRRESWAGDVTCGVCLSLSGDQTSAAATLYCLECLESMCDRCAKTHGSLKIGKAHTTKPIEECYNSLANCMQLSGSQCMEHPAKEIEIYCLNCKVAGCMLCFIQNHQSHKCSDVQKFADDFKTRIASDIGELEKLIQENRKQSFNVVSSTADFENEVALAETLVRQRSKQLESLVEAHKSELLKKVSAFREEQLREYDTAEETLQTQTTIFKSFTRFALEVIDKGSPSDIARIACDLDTRAIKLKAHTVVDIGTQSTILFLTGNSNFLRTEDNWNIVGKLLFDFHTTSVGKISSNYRSHKNANEITKCPMCLKVFHRPTMLPCIHTFCLECLQLHEKETKSRNCPICTESYECTIGGDNKPRISSNVFVEKLITAEKSTDELYISSKRCDVCRTRHGKDGSKKAEMLCLDCVEYFCDRCARMHTSMKSGRDHRVRSTRDKLSLKEYVQLLLSRCDDHQNMALEVYCFDCRTVVCPMCFIRKHRSHKCSEVDEVAKEFKTKIQADVEELERLVGRIGKQIRDVQTIAKSFGKHVDETEADILNRGETIKRLVKENRQGLLTRVRELKEKQVDVYRSIEDELQWQMTSFESFKNFSTELIGKALPSDIATLAHDLGNRSTKLKVQVVPRIEKRAILSFVPEDLTSLKMTTNDWNIVGKLSFTGSSVNPSSDHSRNDPTVVSKIQFKSTVRGMTVLRQDLFVVLDQSPEIHVYKSDRLDFARTVSIIGMTNPWGIVSCENALFVGSYQAEVLSNRSMLSKALSTWSSSRVYSNRIFKILLPDLETSATWTLGTINANRISKRDDDFSLSISKRGSLLVCYSEERIIREYTTQGGLIREMSLPNCFDTDIYGKGTKIDNICRVCHLANDEYVAQVESNRLTWICLMNGEPRLIAYHGETNLCLGCVDRRSGCILAVDSPNDRIVLMNSSFDVIIYVINRLSRFSGIPSRMFMGDDWNLFLVDGCSVTLLKV